jgi:hypothetical protein
LFQPEYNRVIIDWYKIDDQSFTTALLTMFTSTTCKTMLTVDKSICYLAHQLVAIGYKCIWTFFSITIIWCLSYMS